MRLHIDDDSIHGALVRLLIRAGHDVRIPADVGLSGADDPVYLTRAILDSHILLSRIHDDFRKLHELVVTSATGIQASSWYARTTTPTAT